MDKENISNKENISRDEIAEAMKNEFGLIESYVWILLMTLLILL